MNRQPIQEEADNQSDLSDDGLVGMKRLKHRSQARRGQDYVDVLRLPQNKRPQLVRNKMHSWRNHPSPKQEARQDSVPDREAMEAAERVGADIDAVQLYRQSSSFSERADRYAISDKASTTDMTVESEVLANRSRDPFDKYLYSRTLIDDVTTTSVDDDIYQDELTLNHSYMRQAKNFNYFMPDLCGTPSHGLDASERHDYSQTVTSDQSGTFDDNVDDTFLNTIDLSKSGDTLFQGVDRIPSVASDNQCNDIVPLLSRSEIDSSSSQVTDKIQKRNRLQREKSKSMRQLNFLPPSFPVDQHGNAAPSVVEEPANAPKALNTEPSLDNHGSEILNNVTVEEPSKKNRFQRVKSKSLDGMNGFFTAKEAEGYAESAVDKHIVDPDVSPEKKQKQTSRWASRWSLPFRRRPDDDSTLSPQSLLFSKDEEGFEISLHQKAISKKEGHWSTNRGMEASAPQITPDVDIAAKMTSERDIISGTQRVCKIAELSNSNIVDDSTARAISNEVDPIPKPNTVMKLSKRGLRSFVKKINLKKLACPRREKPVSTLTLEPCTEAATEVDPCLTSPEDLSNPKTLMVVAKKKMKRRNSSFKSAPLILLPSIGETAESDGSANSRQVAVSAKAENLGEIVDVPSKDSTLEVARKVNLLNNTIDDDDSLGDWLRHKLETEQVLEATGSMGCYGLEEPVDRFHVLVEDDESVQISTHSTASAAETYVPDEVPEKVHPANIGGMHATSFFLCCSFGTRRPVVEETKTEPGSAIHFDDSLSQGTQSTDCDYDEGQVEFDELINAYSTLSAQYPDDEIKAVRTLGDETHSDETNVSVGKAIRVIKKHAAMNGVTEQELVEVLADHTTQRQSDNWLVEVGEATDEFFYQVAACVQK